MTDAAEVHEGQELLKPAEVAERARASLSQVYRWAAEPGCPVIRLGRVKGVRFLWPALLQWLEERTRMQAVGLYAPPARKASDNGQPRRRRGRPTLYEQRMRERRWVT